MGSRKGTRSEKGKARTKKKLTLSKETLKDLAPGARRAGEMKGGRLHACTVDRSGCAAN